MNRQNKTKGISNKQLKEFGIGEDFLDMSEDMNQLKNKTPNIVISECLRNFSFIQSHYQEQSLKKKNKYVMTLSIFDKLQFDYYRNKKLLKPSKIKFKNLYKKYNGQDLNNKTLLIWRTGGIGDLLFIQPNLYYLKEKYPQCKIIFACGPQYQPMLDNWDCIDELITLPFSFNYLINSDYHIIFEGVIERCKEAEKLNCYKLFTKWLNLNLPEERLKPKLNTKPDLVDKCKNILFDEFNLDIYNDKTILCQYKASSKIRSLDPEIFCELVNKLNLKGYKVIITDNPNESNNIDYIIERYINDKSKVFNFSKFSKSIDYTISLCSLVKCCVSVDSSLIHIASALGTSVVGIYGPFPGELRLETYENCDWVNCKSDCSPCFTHGPGPCEYANAKGYGKCFNNIDHTEIINKVDRLYYDKNNVDRKE